MKAIYKTASPYQGDALSLPVKDLEAALPYYSSLMGFQVLSRQDDLYPSAILGRDNVRIGLAENGGDPSQNGCFFEVNNVEAAFEELKANGLKKKAAGYRLDQRGETSFQVFFLIAPDGLCYCLGERQV